MAAHVLLLHLLVASPGLIPDLEPPPPIAGQTLALASAGALAGDLAVIGAGYLTLQLFANGAISPTAGNFRRAAYGFLAATTLVPPLTAVLLGRLGRGGRNATVWKALALATLGQVAALAAGYAAWPSYWVALPVQLAAVSLGTSLGLHWGGRARGAAAIHRPAPRAADPPAPERTALFVPLCLDAG